MSSFEDTVLEKRLIHRVGRYTASWRKFLYAMNIFGIILAAVLLGLAAWYSISDELHMMMPLWGFYVCIAFGSVMLAFSFVGIIGTYSAPGYIVRQRCNGWMFTYQLAVLVVFVLTIVSAVALLGFLKNIEGARTGSPRGIAFESDIRAWKAAHKSRWLDIEALFECCGFDSVSESDRKECGGHTALKACKSLLYSAAETKLIVIGVLSVVFAFALLCAMMGSCCVVWRKPAARPSLASRADD